MVIRLAIGLFGNTKCYVHVIPILDNHEVTIDWGVLVCSEAWVFMRVVTDLERLLSRKAEVE